MTEQQYYDDPKRAESLISILTQSPYNVTDTNLCRAIAALGEGAIYIFWTQRSFFK